MSTSNDRLVFWGCFIALITTAFAFITRAFLVNDPALWPADFGLDQVQGQELFQAGVWPFAISIILFSLIIDQVGYRAAMLFSFVCYALYAWLALGAYGTVNADGLAGDALASAQADAYNDLYIGSIILGLGNGTVEAFINPVVATMFHRLLALPAAVRAGYDVSSLRMVAHSAAPTPIELKRQMLDCPECRKKVTDPIDSLPPHILPLPLCIYEARRTQANINLLAYQFLMILYDDIWS